MKQKKKSGKENANEAIGKILQLGKYMNENKDMFSEFGKMATAKTLIKMKDKTQITQEIEQQREFKGQGSIARQTVGDQISLANQCVLPIEKLRKVYLKDLQVSTPTENCVLFVKTFCKPSQMVAVNVGIEDEEGNCIHISLYNQVKEFGDLRYLDSCFPLRLKFAIKNPYLKLNAYGHAFLRNDNPENIQIIEENTTLKSQSDYAQLKERGNQLFKSQNYKKAIESYLQALKIAQTSDEKVIANSNIAQSFLEENKYQPALQYTNEALSFDGKHQKSLYRKSIALIGLCDFEQAIVCLQLLIKQQPECIKLLVESQYKLDKQINGYSSEEMAIIIKNNEANKLVNFIRNIEIRKTQNMGRGVFAINDIKRHEVLAVTDRIFASKNKNDHLIEYVNNSNIVNFNTQYYLRQKIILEAKENIHLRKQLSYLYRGDIKGREYQIPNLKDTYVQKYYTEGEDENPELTADDVQNITNFNTFGNGEQTDLYVFASFFNHKREPDIELYSLSDKVIIVASRNIKKNDQIFVSYLASPIKDEAQRLKTLQKWGITDEQ